MLKVTFKFNKLLRFSKPLYFLIATYFRPFPSHPAKNRMIHLSLARERSFFYNNNGYIKIDISEFVAKNIMKNSPLKNQLHKYRIQPPIKFITHLFKLAYFFKPDFFMKFYTHCIFRIYPCYHTMHSIVFR